MLSIQENGEMLTSVGHENYQNMPKGDSLVPTSSDFGGVSLFAAWELRRLQTPLCSGTAAAVPAHNGGTAPHRG